jgi:hypothetical protein
VGIFIGREKQTGMPVWRKRRISAGPDGSEWKMKKNENRKGSG